METVVDLEPEALERVRALASESGQTIGKILSDVLLGHHADLLKQEVRVEIDREGWPEIRVGSPTTPEQIKAMIAEDEEWEITRGNPYHPWYQVDPDRAERFPEGYPRVVDGPFGLPEVQLRPLGGEPSAGTGNEA